MKILFFFCLISAVGFVCLHLTNYGVLKAEIRRIVWMHNDYRRDVRKGRDAIQPRAKELPDLEYSYKLAERAQRIANECEIVTQKDFEVVTLAGRSTFYMTSTKRNICYKWDNVIDSWYQQRHFFAYFSPPPLPKTMAYYQIVNAYSKYVGCGYAQCVDVCNDDVTTYKNIFVCIYNERPIAPRLHPYEADRTCRTDVCYGK